MAEFSELSDRKYNIVQAGTAKDSDGAIMPIYMNFRNPLVVDADNKFYFQVYNEYFQKARSKGYDGIIVKNVIDNPRGEQRAIDVFIVFNSNQIKSVYNRGTFDPNNDNIYYQGQIADNVVNMPTVEEFKNPVRDYELPRLNKGDLRKLGKEDKPVVLKKNIIEKNKRNHPEVDVSEYDKILIDTLINTSEIIQVQPQRKPNYYTFIKLI